MSKKDVKTALVEAGADVIKILNFFGINTDHTYKGKNIRCPFHDDKDPSMKINEDNSVHCFGCDIHLDLVQLYAALKTKDIDAGKSIWDSDNLTSMLSVMIKDLSLELSIDLSSGDFKDEQQAYFDQLKEYGLETIYDSLYLKNPPMNDQQYTPLRLFAKSAYIYKDYKTKEALAVKVRYEAYIGEAQEKILYTKKDNDFVEYKKATPETPLKRKSFRFYDIVDGKVISKPLPPNKKDILYNGEKVFEISNDKYKKGKTWIWITEGEKDVESLKEYGFIACSLMNGASSKWSFQYNDVFKECNVIISSDYDNAGLEYEKTLFDALLYATNEEIDSRTGIEKHCAIGLKIVNKKFYEINKMPEKSDITDLIEKWKHDGLTRQEIIENLKEIIERSIDYKGISSVKEDENGLYYGKKRIADFHINDAINIISVDNSQSDMIELTIQGTGTTNRKPHTRIACIHEIFGSPDAFNKTFSVMDSTFLGSKEQLFTMKRFIMKYKMFRSKYMYSSNGMHKHYGEWITVTPDGSLRSDGTFDKDIFSSNNIMYNDLCNVEVPDENKINKVVPALLNFNVQEVVYNVLGEVGCKLLNTRYKELGIKNHLFSLNGTKGAGKTESSVKIIAAITNNNTRGEFNLTGQTNFTFLKNVCSNNIGGMILQELKLGKMSEYDKNKWSEIFRNNYDRAKSQRGTKDQELNQYDQNNPIITTGEEGIGEESALYERFNIVFMTADKRKSNPVYSENFRVLCDNQNILRGIGKQLIIDIMNLSDKEIIGARNDIEKKIRNKGLDKKGFVDRVLNNAINVIHGLKVLSSTLKGLGYNGTIDLEEGFDTIINNFIENILRLNDDSTASDDYQKMLLQYQRALDNDYEAKAVGEAGKAYIVSDGELYISILKLRTVIAHFVQDSKQDTIILSESEFRKNLIKADYIRENKSWRKKFNKENAKGWYYKVNICKIRSLGLGFIDELITKKEIKDEKSEDFLNYNGSTNIDCNEIMSDEEYQEKYF